jgi:hypothetical protein
MEALDVPYKVCTKCHTPFPATLLYFRRDSRKADGIGVTCRPCNTLSKRQWRLENQAHVQAYNRDWKRSHPELVRAQSQRTYKRDPAKMIARADAWRRAHPEQRRATKRAWWQKNATQLNAARRRNPEKRREQFQAWSARNPTYSREWYAAHQASILARCQARYAANAERFRAQGVIQNARRRARRRGLPDLLTPQEWQHAVAFWGECCAVCETSVSDSGKTLAQDHWIPLTDTTCPGTVAWNTVPLCNGRGGCNTLKRNHDPYLFLLRYFDNEARAQEKYQEIETFLLYMKERYGD